MSNHSDRQVLNFVYTSGWLSLAGKWLYEVGELDSFNRAEVTAVKQYVSSRSEFLTDTGHGHRFWPVNVRGLKQPHRDALDLVFTGNAFEAPPRVRHQRPRPRRSRLRRTLRALVLWLLQPSPFTHRARRR